MSRRPSGLTRKEIVQRSIFKRKLALGKILPPDTEANLKPYKEPLEPVDVGFGYKGTVAHSKDGTHVQCHICGYFFVSVSHHIKQVHGISTREYKKTFQLEKRSSLMAELVQLKYKQASMRRSVKLKKHILAELAKGREKSHRNPSLTHHNKKSLERKNREGRCYYQLLEKIEAVGKKVGRTPTMKDFEKVYGKGFNYSITSTFGTWNQAVSLAGFTPNAFSGSRAKHGRDFVIAAIRNFYEIEDRVPRSSDMGVGIPSKWTIYRLFGGIVEARRAAGFGQNDYVHEVEL